MGFFSRQKDARIPPGQVLTEKLPVLHSGPVPAIDPLAWDFRMQGMVEEERVWSFDEIRALPETTTVADIRCVTKWSKLDTEWEGVAVADLVGEVTVAPEASHVLIWAEQGFTANLPIEDFLREGNLFAYRFDGADLSPEHGWPLRLVVPHLYFWKSAKWVRGVRFLDHDVPGYWERNGYSMYGDPWKEQRFWGD